MPCSLALPLALSCGALQAVRYLFGNKVQFSPGMQGLAASVCACALIMQEPCQLFSGRSAWKETKSKRPGSNKPELCVRAQTYQGV